LEVRKECNRSDENGVKLYLLISVQDINNVTQRAKKPLSGNWCRDGWLILMASAIDNKNYKLAV
jgi:hypothetical protein